MANQPKSTEINQTAITPFDALEDNDKVYVDMAVNGYTYRHIAEAAKREYQTVKTWFMRGGRLHDAYKQRQKEYRKEYNATFKQIKQLLRDGAVDAVLKLREAVRAKGVWPTHIIAAKDILSRAGFDPVEKTESIVSQKTDTPLVEAALKELNEADTETDK